MCGFCHALASKRHSTDFQYQSSIYKCHYIVLTKGGAKIRERPNANVRKTPLDKGQKQHEVQEK